MKTAIETVLGVSLGTRSIGLAVFKGSELIHWKVQCFKGSWSKSKLSLITGVFSNLIDQYNPSAVILRLPNSSQSSKGIAQLIKSISKICAKKATSVEQCTLYSLKRKYISAQLSKNNKEVLIASVAATYPELQHEYRKAQRSRNPYYQKMFEAVASASLFASREVQR